MSKTEKPYKEGEVLYEVNLDSDTGKFETDIWVVRTIRGGKITAICKNKYTWVKLSTKHGDWGWDPSIPAVWRETWAVGRHPRRNIRRTRLEAWTLEWADLERWYDDGPEPCHPFMISNPLGSLVYRRSAADVVLAQDAEFYKYRKMLTDVMAGAIDAGYFGEQPRR